MMHKYFDSVKELFFYYTALLILCAFGFSYFEHKPFFDSLWWTIVTASTTGYGDFYPITTGGRIVAAILMHISIFFILPLIIGTITERIVVDKDAFTDSEQENIKQELKEIKEIVSKGRKV